MRISGGLGSSSPLLPRLWRHDLQISNKQLSRHHPDHPSNQPQRQMPEHDADGDLFPQPSMLVGFWVAAWR